jgi:multidrug efflux system membrane fusion protein
MTRWFIIVGLALSLLVGGLVWFNGFRGEMIKQILSKPPPPATVASSKRAWTISCRSLSA